METLKKLLDWIKSLPTFGKVLTILAIALALAAIVFTSCGTSRTATKVMNRAHGTSTTITQTSQGGTVQVEIKPSLDVKIDSTQLLNKR